MRVAFVNTKTGECIDIVEEFEEAAWFELARRLGMENPRAAVFQLKTEWACSSGEKREDRYVDLALVPDEPAGSCPLDLAERGSERAAEKWTDEQVARVDDAIRDCARSMDRFTTDDVWERVPDIPITKGIGSRLLAASRSGVIQNTGDTTIARRGGRHDHAQRLTVWASLERSS